MSFISRILPDRTPRPPLLLEAALVQSTSDYADYDCVQAVVNYVNATQSKALMTFEELPPAAVEIYEVDRYLAQVNNGGHGQYWHNCGRHLAQIAPAVERGLRAIKAKRHLKAFRHFAKEMRGQEPAADFEASRQMSIHFNVLDDEFFRAEKSEPLAEKQAKRIRGMRDVVLLDRDALAEAFDDLAQANPKFEARNAANEIAQVNVWFSNPQIFTAGWALAQAETPDLFGRLAGGGRIIDIAGQAGYLFVAETLNSEAVIIFNDAVCFAHEKLSPEAIAAERARRAAGDEPEKSQPDFRDRLWALDGAGRRLAAFPVHEVEAIMARAAELNMGLAAFALLQAAGCSDPITHAGCLSTFESMQEDGEVAVMIRAGDALMMVVANAGGATLWTHDATRQLAEISAAELSDRAEALREA